MHPQKLPVIAYLKLGIGHCAGVDRPRCQYGRSSSSMVVPHHKTILPHFVTKCQAVVKPWKIYADILLEAACKYLGTWEVRNHTFALDYWSNWEPNQLLVHNFIPNFISNRCIDHFLAQIWTKKPLWCPASNNPVYGFFFVCVRWLWFWHEQNEAKRNSKKVVKSTDCYRWQNRSTRRRNYGL